MLENISTNIAYDDLTESAYNNTKQDYKHVVKQQDKYISHMIT